MGWGSSTRRGGGRKVRALPRKFVLPGFGREELGMSRGNFAGMSRTSRSVQKICAKKSMCALFVPYTCNPLRLAINIFEMQLQLPTGNSQAPFPLDCNCLFALCKDNALTLCGHGHALCTQNHHHPHHHQHNNASDKNNNHDHSSDIDNIPLTPTTPDLDDHPTRQHVLCKLGSFVLAFS